MSVYLAPVDHIRNVIDRDGRLCYVCGEDNLKESNAHHIGLIHSNKKINHNTMCDRVQVNGKCLEVGWYSSVREMQTGGGL
jgi:hypothetical protein